MDVVKAPYETMCKETSEGVGSLEAKWKNIPPPRSRSVVGGADRGPLPTMAKTKPLELTYSCCLRRTAEGLVFMFQAASNSPGLLYAMGLCMSYSQTTFEAGSIGTATWFSSFNMFPP